MRVRYVCVMFSRAHVSVACMGTGPITSARSGCIVALRPIRFGEQSAIHFRPAQSWQVGGGGYLFNEDPQQAICHC